jgi:glycosyltransferase involved in cell wall biosynthesis
MDALGTKIVMEGERGGFLVNDLEGFVDKTLTLLKDEKIYLAKQQEALKRGHELTFEQTGKILEETYREVLALPKYRKNL